MSRAFDQEVRDAFGFFAPTVVDIDETAPPLWTPFSGPQSAALTSEADELLFGGAGGGGKSDLVLGLCITGHRNSVIFRTEFAQFRGPDGMIERSKSIIGVRGRLNESTFNWRGLPGGRAFEFAGVKNEKDLGKWRGRPHDLKCFDELTEFPEHHYRFLIGWLRTAIPGQRTRVVATCNPPTSAQGQWVVKYWAPWLDKQHPRPAKPGELRWFATVGGKDVERPNGDHFWIGGRDDCTHQANDAHTACLRCPAEYVRPRSRTFIPARVEDNPYYMQTGYVDVLNNLPEPLRSQLRHGDFTATQDDDPWQVIPTAWVREAQRRWRESGRPDVPLSSIGNDPSRGGDDRFCIAKRYGWWVAPVIKHEGKEAPDGQHGLRLLLDAIGQEAPGTVNIDIGGSAGSAVFDQARDANLPAVALNGSEHSDGRDRSGQLGFANKRAQWYWAVREHLDPTSGQNVALPDDPELLSDLCATRWKITPRGIQCEDKLLVKKRLGRSPDVGEAVIYAFAEDAGHGFGMLAFANAKVAEAKALEREQQAQARAEAAATPEPNPWLAALPHTPQE